MAAARCGSFLVVVVFVGRERGQLRAARAELGDEGVSVVRRQLLGVGGVDGGAGRMLHPRVVEGRVLLPIDEAAPIHHLRQRGGADTGDGRLRSRRESAGVRCVVDARVDLERVL